MACRNPNWVTTSDVVKKLDYFNWLGATPTWMGDRKCKSEAKVHTIACPKGSTRKITLNKFERLNREIGYKVGKIGNKLDWRPKQDPGSDQDADVLYKCALELQDGYA